MSFVVADVAGNIAWTLIGRIPRRAGATDGELPVLPSSGSRPWEGLLAPEEVPTIAAPASGRVWAANNRIVDGDMLAKLGNGSYTLGARARQIRDGLSALDRATPADMLRIQLDDRALFLERWRKLLLDVLSPEALAADPRRRELRELVEHWGGRAAVGSAGYRMVRSYRVLLSRDVFDSLTAPCKKIDPNFDYTNFAFQMEGPLWELVTQQPPHLLNPQYKSWREQLLAAADEVVALFSSQGALRERTWGERNTTAIRHVLSPALPGLGKFLLDMPAAQLPGDEEMPRVQDTDYGSTLRMVISPGREAEGLFHMPGGQSGNPLSPHYSDAYEAWVRGTATPFLPGPAVHELRLVPQKGQG
jgi:penicillin G amidase